MAFTFKSKYYDGIKTLTKAVFLKAATVMTVAILSRCMVVVGQESVGGTISTTLRGDGGKPQCIEMVGRIREDFCPAVE